MAPEWNWNASQCPFAPKGVAQPATGPCLNGASSLSNKEDDTPIRKSTHEAGEVDKVGLIGFGALGKMIAEGWADMPSRFHLSVVCVRPHQADHARELLGERVKVVEQVRHLLDEGPAVVIEAAGQDCVRDYGEQILQCGADLYLLSVGALACDDFHRALIATGEKSNSRIFLPAGAMAGFDGLLALKRQGLERVTYTSVKPPSAWLNTIAEHDHDLEALNQRQTLFEGSARQAALDFPRNANLAAAIAIAGIGLDSTQVHLVADPAIEGNLGRLYAEGAGGRLMVEVHGNAAEKNPKSSAVVAMSVLSSIQNRVAVLSYV
ncbi:aspartate dehydrogenase [Novosphingobium sp. 11B]